MTSDRSESAQTHTGDTPDTDQQAADTTGAAGTGSTDAGAQPAGASPEQAGPEHASPEHASPTTASTEQAYDQPHPTTTSGQPAWASQPAPARTAAYGEQPGEPPAGPGLAGTIVGGAAAVVSAGFGLLSLTGTSLGQMQQRRQELIGEIEAGQAGDPGGLIDAIFTSPFNTVALINGIFAIAALLIGVVALVVLANKAAVATWMAPVAAGGAVLGVLGLLVAGGMYFDLFGGAPEVPDMPQPGAPPGP